MNRAPELDLARPAWYGLRYVGKLVAVEIRERVMDDARSWAPRAR
ncbi:MAG: hypothetical protein P8Y92_14700 [Halioglobus sp.]